MSGEASYTISEIPKVKIALFHYSGPITLEDRRNNTRAMKDFCEQHNIHKLIIDGRDQESKTDTVESFEFAKDVPDELRGLRIAVVHRPDDQSLPFIETVASNRGSYTRTFLNLDAAQAWLESLD